MRRIIERDNVFLSNYNRKFRSCRYIYFNNHDKLVRSSSEESKGGASLAYSQENVLIDNHCIYNGVFYYVKFSTMWQNYS